MKFNFSNMFQFKLFAKPPYLLHVDIILDLSNRLSTHMRPGASVFTAPSTYQGFRAPNPWMQTLKLYPFRCNFRGHIRRKFLFNTFYSLFIFYFRRAS